MPVVTNVCMGVDVCLSCHSLYCSNNEYVNCVFRAPSGGGGGGGYSPGYPQGVPSPPSVNVQPTAVSTAPQPKPNPAPIPKPVTDTCMDTTMSPFHVVGDDSVVTSEGPTPTSTLALPDAVGDGSDHDGSGAVCYTAVMRQGESVPTASTQTATNAHPPPPSYVAVTEHTIDADFQMALQLSQEEEQLQLPLQQQPQQRNVHDADFLLALRLAEEQVLNSGRRDSGVGGEELSRQSRHHLQPQLTRRHPPQNQAPGGRKHRSSGGGCIIF